jgi:transcriptional regulator with XRE-family HTH domain
MPTDDRRAAIASAVLAEMTAQGKTQRELADVLGIDQGSTFLRVRGRRSFRAEEIVAIAEWLGRPVEQFASERVA